MPRSPVLAAVVLFALSGCQGATALSDASTLDGASTLDVDIPDASSPVDASEADAAPPPDMSERTGPATVVRSGTSGVILRGVVLGPDGPLDPGEVLVVGNTVRCVATSCASDPAAADATVVDTQGIISPGLIDAHNHLAYNFFDEWVPPMQYGNRYEWADDPSYEEFIKPYADNRSTGSTYCPAAKWGELRSLIHGTTTVQGQSFQQGCVNVFVRNADHYDGLGYNHLTTYIGSVRDLNDEQAASLVARFTAADEPLLRYAVHMAEGISGTNLLAEFDSFAGRDTRNNRHAGTSLLSGPGFDGVAVLIHSVPLSETQVAEAAAANAKFVWSPSSNFALYGQTADIASWLNAGATVGIGPDWTPSGEDDLLAELRFARDYARTTGIASLTSRKLWEMATVDGADVVGLGPDVGRLAVGARADLLVVGRRGADPYDALIDANAADVRLTFVDGRAYYGDASLEAALGLNGDCDALDACGEPKFLCVKNVPATQSGSVSRTDEDLDAVASQLRTILGNYGRTDLLPLVHECRD